MRSFNCGIDTTGSFDPSCVRASASGVLFSPDFSAVLAVKSKKPKHGERFFGLPGGKKELGETIEEGFKREFMEEAGLNVSDYVYIGRKILNLRPGDEDYLHVFFWVKSCSGILPTVPGIDPMTGEEETSPPQWVPLSEVVPGNFLETHMPAVREALLLAAKDHVDAVWGLRLLPQYG